MSISRRTEWAIDTDGRGIAGASVTVKTASTGALAVLYADVDGAIPLSNPVKTDATGKYTYCTEAAIYNEYISRLGYDNLTINDVIVGLVPGPTGAPGAPLTSTVVPIVSSGMGKIGTSSQAAKADHVHPEQNVWNKVQTFTNAVSFQSIISVTGMVTGAGFLANRSQGLTMLGNTFSSVLFYDQNSGRSGEAEFTYKAATDKVQLRIRVDNLNFDVTKMGYFGAEPQPKPVVIGDIGGNEALGSLIASLAKIGFITNSTTG